MDKGMGAFIAIWIVGALLSVGVTAVLIWGIVRVVLHFT